MSQAPQENNQRPTAKQLLVIGALSPDQQGNGPSTLSTLAQQGTAAALMPEQSTQQPDGTQPQQRLDILAGALAPLPEEKKPSTISTLLQAGLGYETNDGKSHLLSTITQVGLAPIDNTPRDAEGNLLAKSPGALKQIGRAARTGLGIPEMSVTPATIAATGVHYLAKGVQAALAENTEKEAKVLQEQAKEKAVRQKAKNLADAKIQEEILTPMWVAEELRKKQKEAQDLVEKANRRQEKELRREAKAQQKQVQYEQFMQGAKEKGSAAAQAARNFTQEKGSAAAQAARNFTQEKGSAAAQAAKYGIKTLWQKITKDYNNS